MALTYIKLPLSGGAGTSTWAAPVADYASLPAGNSVGEARVTTDTYDIYIWNGSSWVSEGGVSGPASTTDNAIVRWNGSTGQLIQNSAVIIDDSDNITGVTTIAVDATSNQIVLGVTNTTTINSTTPSAPRTVTLPDAGTNSSFVLTESNQTINGNKTLSGTTNLSNLTASTPLKLDSSKNIVSQDLDLTTDVTGVLPVANGGTNSSTSLNNNRIMISSSDAIVEASALTNGQLLIGSTGVAPAAATITGTSNQVNVSNGAGSITLSTPQNIHSAATPTFASETLTATTNQLTLGTTNTTIITSPAPSASRVVTLPDAGTNSSFVLTESNQTINGIKTLSSSPVLKDGLLLEDPDAGTNTLKLTVSSSIASDYTVTLPAAVASVNDSALTSDTSGNTSWSRVILPSSGDLKEGSFSISNNQAVSANVTNFTFANASVRAFEAIVSVYINATSALYEEFKINAIQKGSSWETMITSVGDNSQIVLSVSTSGQVQYTSGNYSGFSAGTLKYRAQTTSV